MKEEIDVMEVISDWRKQFIGAEDYWEGFSQDMIDELEYKVEEVMNKYPN